MNDLIIKNFKGANIYNFVWNDRPCWVANDIATIFDYNNTSKAIMNCIKKENFQVDFEYSILENEELKIFKEIFSDELGATKFAPKIVIFYEEGLYGFLSYTEMPIGVEFRSWLRREVLPSLRKKGYYTCNNQEMSFNNNEKDICSDDVNTTDFTLKDEKLIRLSKAYESAKLFKDLLDDITKDTTYKFLLIKQIYNEAGINLPKYIEEERF